jgi:hypothetical protein
MIFNDWAIIVKVWQSASKFQELVRTNDAMIRLAQIVTGHLINATQPFRGYTFTIVE